ncbi:MAG: T9SS type A sorting domain-containing protein [Saprospiraceae bacterium]|nr:T9SS type A sorting domain-containing protein [Saprospiraceae bacterium]
MFDQKGRKLLTSEFNAAFNNTIYINHLTAGLYNLQIITNKAEYKTKFFKM